MEEIPCASSPWNVWTRGKTCQVGWRSRPPAIPGCRRQIGRCRYEDGSTRMTGHRPVQTEGKGGGVETAEGTGPTSLARRLFLLFFSFSFSLFSFLFDWPTDFSPGTLTPCQAHGAIGSRADQRRITLASVIPFGVRVRVRREQAAERELTKPHRTPQTTEQEGTQSRSRQLCHRPSTTNPDPALVHCTFFSTALPFFSSSPSLLFNFCFNLSFLFSIHSLRTDNHSPYPDPCVCVCHSLFGFSLPGTVIVPCLHSRYNYHTTHHDAYFRPSCPRRGLLDLCRGSAGL